MKLWPSEYRSSSLTHGASSSSSAPSNIQYTELSELYTLKRVRLLSRNKETLTWGIVAKRQIKTGTFIGFFTGRFVPVASFKEIESLYAVQIDRMHIVPFQNEQTISYSDRQTHSMANMNEPHVGQRANCCMQVQDFAHSEVHNVESIPNHTDARFFRGLACFACCDISAGEELTWYYGKAYEPNRRKQGYEAGKDCQLFEDRQVFIPSDSSGAIEAVGGKVAATAVYPVFSTTMKSERFKPPQNRKRRRDSNSDEDSSSSGSGHEVYKPKEQSRQDRLDKRSIVSRG